MKISRRNMSGKWAGGEVRLISFTTSIVAGALLALTVTTSASALSSQKLMAKLQWRSVGPYIGGRVVTVEGEPADASESGGQRWALSCSADGAELCGTSASLASAVNGPARFRNRRFRESLQDSYLDLT